MPKPRSFLLHLLLIASCIANGATADDAPSQGEWQLLHASIGVSAMHMQLLPGDFVLMFDRTDTGPSNISLAALAPCAATVDAADCTAHSVLLDLRSNVLHPYPLATNPWCSSGALLPNGTLLQTGGFSSGDRVARLFSPATGWVELPSFLAARLWYATDMILPDGRVLILGGRRQFNLEYFPHADAAPALTFFPFLDETTEPDAENNLYPFLHLLPDGTVFVFANDRAVVFDPYNRAPLRRLPPVPGGVPRNYPSSGSSVLLPLRPDAPAHAEVLEMPMARVMGDMVLLPTGDVLIVNGAAAGSAGWELGRDPVTRPVLYRPDAPLGSRFDQSSPLAASAVPRMYHSSAALDTYGRVLVGGSNPHVGYVFANVTYPTELSLEAFLPPYMDPRHDSARPRRSGAGAGAGAGGEVVRVAAVAPAFATHSFGMNQPVVELAVGRVAEMDVGVYEAVVAAPPMPGVAPPGYYKWFVVHAGVPSSSAAWVRMRPLGPGT
ncbi:unnamed protein product [Miscanthus lutarioriparius]|uniref:Uncharacterized protein n=1 Tax=Miscanthus lutarioriparius TaxID=422564 RepID=A0A811QPA8_9POAL|nr:unnamed protein product [Miscanthus lutarioriparius]